MTAQVVREFASELRELARVRAFVEESCGDSFQAPHAEQALFQLELAVQEAVTNVIRHAHRDQTGQVLRVGVAADADEVRIEIRYRGDDFNPSSVPPPCFDGSKSGGFGVFIIQKSVDEVSYHRDADGECTVRLVKRAPHGDDAETSSE